MDRRCPRGTLSGPRGPLATPGPARGSLGTLGMVFTTLLFFLTTIQNPENPEGYTASPSLSCPSIQPPAPQRPGAARVDGSKVNVRTHPRPASPQPSVAALPPWLALAPPALCPGVTAVGTRPWEERGPPDGSAPLDFSAVFYSEHFGHFGGGDGLGETRMKWKKTNIMQK